MNQLEDNLLNDTLNEITSPPEGKVTIAFAIVHRPWQTDAEKEHAEKILAEAVQQVIKPLEKATGLNIPVQIEYNYVSAVGNKREGLNNCGKADPERGAAVVIVDLSGPPNQEDRLLKERANAIKFALAHELFHLTGASDDEPHLSEHLADALSANVVGKTEALKGFSKLFPEAITDFRSSTFHPEGSERLNALKNSRYEKRVNGLLAQIKSDAEEGVTTSWLGSLKDKELGGLVAPTRTFKKLICCHKNIIFQILHLGG